MQADTPVSVPGDTRDGAELSPSRAVVKRTSTVPLVAAHILADDEFDRMWRMSKALAASGMFKDVTQAEQAFGRILLGRDLGLTPTQALMSIDVVRGNVQVRSVRLAAWVKQHPSYDYKVIEHDAEHCLIHFFEDGEKLGDSAFSVADAKAAGIYKDGPWKAHPRNMVFARAMSNGVKWYCPDVTGGIPVYTEADTFVDSTAVEIGAGEGDGSAPDWEGVDEERAAKIDGLVAWATEKGLPLFGDLATVRMRLNGQSEKAIDEWIAAAEEQRASVEATS